MCVFGLHLYNLVKNQRTFCVKDFLNLLISSFFIILPVFDESLNFQCLSSFGFYDRFSEFFLCHVCFSVFQISCLHPSCIFFFLFFKAPRLHVSFPGAVSFFFCIYEAFSLFRILITFLLMLSCLFL